MRRTVFLFGVVAACLLLAVAFAEAQDNRTGTTGSGPVGTTGDCPCAAGVPEGEANCGLPGDDTNGGCNSDPVVLSQAVCNTTYCGTVGSGGGTRDTDWWNLDLPFGDNVTVTATMETDMALFALTPVCAPSLVDDGSAPACVEGQVNVSGSAGDNWFFIAGSAFDGYGCGTEYTLTFSCETVPVELESFEIERKK